MRAYEHQTRRIYTSYLGLILLAGCGVDSQAAPPPLTVADFRVVAELGGPGDPDPLAVLRRPRDGVIAEDGEVLVLDAVAPWIRIFHPQGGFQAAHVRFGDQPGEALVPFTLSASEDGFLLTQSQRIDIFDFAGSLTHTVDASGYWVRGATQACDGDVIALGRVHPSPDQLGLILRFRAGDESPDTVQVLSPLRSQSRLWPQGSALKAAGDHILIFTEEEQVPRILEVSCGGSIMRSWVVGDLGEPESIGSAPGNDDTRLAVRAPTPPFFGGLARVDGHTVWATLATQIHRDRVDSLTVLTVVAPQDARREISIQGWYQLYDSDSNGSLLMAHVGSGAPTILLVDGRSVLEIGKSVGIDSPKAPGATP